MNSRAIESQLGFSLIEVVVALAIVALTLGTVYQVSVSSARSTNATDNYLRALSAAQSRLAEISALPTLEPGTRSGSTNGIDWSWSVRPFPGPKPTPGTDLYEIDVTATIRGSSVDLHTLLIGSSSRE